MSSSLQFPGGRTDVQGNFGQLFDQQLTGEPVDRDFFECFCNPVQVIEGAPRQFFKLLVLVHDQLYNTGGIPKSSAIDTAKSGEKHNDATQTDEFR